ncbi:MAG: hypothetical protein U0414_24140 [Polyangiaceae bacterium]
MPSHRRWFLISSGALVALAGCTLTVFRLPDSPAVHTMLNPIAECATAEGYKATIQGESVYVTLDAAADVTFTDSPSKLTVIIDPSKTPEDEVAKRREGARAIGQKIYACAADKVAHAPPPATTSPPDAPSATPSDTSTPSGPSPVGS